MGIFQAFLYRSMNAVALVLACLLTTLPGCGSEGAKPDFGRSSITATGQAGSPESGQTSNSDSRPVADVPKSTNPIRLTCKERQGRSYVAPADLPTWDNSMRILGMHRCLPCHNRNFAANGLLLTTYEEYQVAAESSAKRIKRGLLKPLAAHESYSIQLWLLNGLPKTKQDLDAWDKERCVTLP